MANEIKIAYPVSGSGSISCKAYYDNGGTMTLRSSLALSDTDIATLYVGDDPGTWQDGDVLVFFDGTTPVDAKEYAPDMDVLDALAATPTVIPAGYIGDYIKGETLYFLWRTSVAPTVNGTIKVYKDGDGDEISSSTGITDTRNFDGQTNVHLCSINLAANTFYQKETDFSVVLSGATINGESVNAVIATFSIENRYAGKQFLRDG